MPESRKYFQPELLNKITKLEIRARRVVEGFISGLHKSPFHGFSVEFAEHREYAPGDDLRHIDWRVFARADRLYVKQYEEETNLRAQILLDCSHSMAYPEHKHDGRMTKWEYASTVAASLAFLLMHQKDACGLVLFDHEIRAQLESSANRSQLVNMVRTIESNPPDRETNVKILFHYLAERISRRGMIVVISDLLTDADDLIRALERFKYGNHEVLVMHVLDRDEIEFPFSDNTLFEGMENRTLELLCDPQSLRAGYLEALERFNSKIRTSCINHGMDYCLLSTADPLDIALTRFLARRMHSIRAKA